MCVFSPSGPAPDPASSLTLCLLLRRGKTEWHSLPAPLVLPYLEPTITPADLFCSKSSYGDCPGSGLTTGISQMSSGSADPTEQGSQPQAVRFLYRYIFLSLIVVLAVLHVYTHVMVYTTVQWVWCVFLVYTFNPLPVHVGVYVLTGIGPAWDTLCTVAIGTHVMSINYRGWLCKEEVCRFSCAAVIFCFHCAIKC